MKKELQTQLNQWYEENKHQKIITTILLLPKEELDFELIGHLGRAYNNLGQLDKAIEILMTVAEQGESDEMWNYRMGYSYYYKEAYKKALAFFQRSLELGDGTDEDTIEFCQWCEEDLEEF